MLTHVTTDFESEDLTLIKSNLYLSPSEVLRFLSLIYYQVLKQLNEKDINATQFIQSQSVSLDPMIILREASVILEFQTKDLIQRYSKSLIQKNIDQLNYLCTCVDKLVFGQFISSQNWQVLKELMVEKNLEIQEKYGYDVDLSDKAMIEEKQVEKRLTEIQEEIKDIKSLKQNEIEYIAKTKWIPAHHILDILQNINQDTKVQIYIDLMDKIQDVYTFQFRLFASKSLMFLKQIDEKNLSQNDQFIKNMSANVFRRLRGNFPELKGFLYNLKSLHIFDEVKILKAESLNMITKIRKNEVSQQFLERVIIQYSDKEEEVLKNLKGKVQQSYKYLNSTFQKSVHNNVNTQIIGSFDLGTLYVQYHHYRLDLAVCSELFEDPFKFLESILPLLKLNDSQIIAKNHEFSEKTKINRQYFTLRCSNPEHENDFDIYLIFTKGKDDYIVKQHNEFKEVLNKCYKLKLAYRTISAWAKEYLYDNTVDFDMFSQYELQLLFIDFLKHNQIFTQDLSQMKVNFLQFDSQQFFIDFFIYLLITFKAVQVNPIQTPALDEKCSNKDYKQAQDQDIKIQDNYSFYQMKDKLGNYVDTRILFRDYMDVTSMFRQINQTLKQIIDGINFFD
ncbi:UNKNOWN [Stylonychia lemnae]|uniref:Uncharacterized protein n=1 Tax=Stylonychia lemnae TaxID=5949 RepID=A0A078ANB5_STYLE|nr:UNKNOWN [Stylonychia lemnae]|eukprot:CDW83391.1 UNKNOWN [Stylonychia lemnae]